MYKKITTILLLSVFLLPGVSLAQTSIDDLQAQISSLQSIVNQLLVQLQAITGQTLSTASSVSIESSTDSVTSGTPSVSAYCPHFSTNLRIGDSGADVSMLKQILRDQGFSISEKDSTASVFDEQTASAVTAFQEKYASEILTPVGLTKGTGFVGSSTRAKLNAIVNNYSTCKSSGEVDSVTTLSTYSNVKTNKTVYALTDDITISWQNPVVSSDDTILLYPAITILYANGNVAGESITPVTRGEGYAVISTKGLSSNTSYKVKLSQATASKSYIEAYSNVFQIVDSTTTQIQTPYATIDADSLIGSLPLITGTVYNVVYPFGIVISNDGGKVWSSGDLLVVNNKWTAAVQQDLAPGTYTVQVYSNNVVLTTGQLNVLNDKAPIISFLGSPATTGSVQSWVLSWSASNASRCVLQYGSNEVSVMVKGSRTVSPAETTVYRLWCSSDSGVGKDGLSAEKTVTVIVNTPSVTISVPASGEQLENNNGKTYIRNIQWSTADMDATSYCDVYLTDSNGTRIKQIAANIQCTKGSYGWYADNNIPSGSYRISIVTREDASISGLSGVFSLVTYGYTTVRPSVTIDQSSLTPSSTTPTLTGSSVNVFRPLKISIYNGGGLVWGGGEFEPVNNRWSVSTKSLNPGTYQVQIWLNDGYNLLATADLIIPNQDQTTTSQFPVVISPNGSIVYWNKATTISWKPGVGMSSYDVFLKGKSGTMYTIKQGVVSSGSGDVSIGWTPIKGNYGNDTFYSIMVCQAGTPLCSPASSFTIDDASPVSFTGLISGAFRFRPNSSFILSGETSSIQRMLPVAIVDSNYEGSSDWASVGATLKDGSGYTAVGNVAYPSGNTWRVEFGGLPEGEYTVFIYSSDYTFLGKVTLWITNKG